MKFTAILILSILAFPITAEAKTVKCSPETLQGNWIRFASDNVRMKAVWTFNADNTISCQGSRCKGVVGLPVSYALRKRWISFRFEHGGMSETTCRVRNEALLLVGGGTSKGGFTFKKAK